MMHRYYRDEQVSREPLDDKKLYPYYVEDDTPIVYHHGYYNQIAVEVLASSHVDALLTCIRVAGFNIYKHGFTEISKEKYEKCRQRGDGGKKYAKVTSAFRPIDSVHYYEFYIGHWTEFEKQYSITMYTCNNCFGDLIEKDYLGESPMEATLNAIKKYSLKQSNKKFNGKIVALSKNELEQFLNTMKGNSIPKGLIILEAELLNGVKSSKSYYKVTK